MDAIITFSIMCSIVSVLLLLIFMSILMLTTKPKKIQLLPKFMPLPPSRVFIFDANIINPTNLLSRNMRIKLKLNNKDKFLDAFGNYINEDEIRDNLIVNYISMQDKQFSTQSIDKLDPLYYTIKNTLHLMDPFLTSGKNMIITDDMKGKFEIVLDEKNKIKDTMYQNYESKS